MRGKCYPVDILYSHSAVNSRVEEAVRSAIRMHLHETSGDILAFLTGSEECEQAVKYCYQKLDDLIGAERHVPSCLIYSLYGSQSSEDQARVFERAPTHTRKIIFSTNIAETSLTIDGIGFVIDCGYMKQKKFNPRSGMDCLVTIRISRVQAIQRAGRAGRTQAGKCYRMYSEKIYKEEMEKTTVAEILRVNLTSTVLNLKCIGIADVLSFDFVEKPDDDLIIQALKQLFMLDALTSTGVLTQFGRELCKYPLEPSYSKSLMMAKYLKCQDELLTIVSMLSTENIWQRVTRTNVTEWERQQEIMKKHTQEEGDHYTYLNIFNGWQNNNFSDSWAKRNFINLRALKQSRNIRGQIKDLTKVIDYNNVKAYITGDPIFKMVSEMEDPVQSLSLYQRIAMSLTSAFFYNSARRLHNPNEDYLLLSEGNLVSIDVNSSYYIINKYPEYVVFTELSGQNIERGMMKILSAVEIDWIKPYLSKVKGIDINTLLGGDGKGNSGYEIEGAQNGENGENGVLGKREKAEGEEEASKMRVDDAKARYMARMQKNSELLGEKKKNKKLKK
jgi:ATP-dependent RNA helicase DHX8/PRP22